MKITKIETWSVNLKLAEPYSIAYDSFDSVVNIFLRVETDQGIIGYGCAAPDKYVTGETAEGNLLAIQYVVSPLLQGADPFRFAKLMEDLKRQIPTQPSVLAGSSGRITGRTRPGHHAGRNDLE